MTRLAPTVAAIIMFAVLMAVGAWLSVPMVPVPMSLQTFAVLRAGAVLGPWRGAGAVLIYLAAAAAGLPVLSDGASGPEPFSGPTAGYLLAFPPAAFVTGLAARRGWLDKVPSGLATLVGTHALILALGAAWLARSIGAEGAIQHGVTPFLIGAVVKSALVLATLAGLRRLQLIRRG